MANYFKRRPRPGSNKNELKVRRGAASEARAAGLLSQYYPSVERLTIQLNFLNPAQHPFDQQTRQYGASDPCDFSVPCPGRCNAGSFDLAAKIRAVIEAKETLSESGGVCKQPLYAGSPDVCGFQLRCKIEVTYFPQPA